MLSIFRALSLLFVFYGSTTMGANVPIDVFPMENYNQNVDYWLNDAKVQNFNQSLLTPTQQQQYFSDFKKHWLSPWNSSYVATVLTQTGPSISEVEKEIFTEFDNHGKSADKENYGENFRAYSETWINDIKENIDLDALDNLQYDPRQRAILVENTEGRALPTNEVSFYQFTLPGQGYPFDNLQMTSLWVGTPVYVIGETKDHVWRLVLTPAVIAWVPSHSLAFVGDSFVKSWRTAAKTKLAAITQTKTPLRNSLGDGLSFDTYVGSVFPVVSAVDPEDLMFPLRQRNGMAGIGYMKLPEGKAVIMPYAITPHHFANVMKTLIGRPYGWGGMYYYNDCSQELKSLYAPFGIWLPRHSSNQVTVGRVDDETGLKAKKRIPYLVKNGHPFMTIVYIGGHVFQYLGNFEDPNDPAHASVPLSYQNVWGLSPKNRKRRSVIGKAVIFPILWKYPEDKSLASLANKSYFKLGYLDEPATSVESLAITKPKVDLRALMLP